MPRRAVIPFTREKQLADIRAKCIEANPKIFEYVGHEMKGKDAVNVYRERPIRLADVLLAIAEKEELQSFGTTHMAAHGGFYKEGVLLCSWNLRTDDLTKQSPETIAFIHSLLVTV